jgi:hypothetical protein
MKDEMALPRLQVAAKKINASSDKSDRSDLFLQ